MNRKEIQRETQAKIREAQIENNADTTPLKKNLKPHEIVGGTYSDFKKRLDERRLEERVEERIDNTSGQVKP